MNGMFNGFLYIFVVILELKKDWEPWNSKKNDLNNLRYNVFEETFLCIYQRNE